MLSFTNARRPTPLKIAGLIHHAGDEHLGQQRQQAGTADAARLFSLPADHAISRLQGFLIDPHLFDGTDRGAHAVLDPRTFERRPGRTGTGDQPVCIAKHRLAVRAYVNEERKLRRLVHLRAEHACADISADIAGHTRQAIHLRPGMHDQSQLAGCNGRRMVDHRDERHQADGFRWDGQEEMDHRRIAGHGQLHDLLGIGLHLLAGGLQQLIDGADDQLLQFGQAVGLLSIDDARDHIFPARDLAVIVAGLRQHLAALQVYQPDGNRGRADIYGRAQVAIRMIARQKGQQLRRAVRSVP